MLLLLLGIYMMALVCRIMVNFEENQDLDREYQDWPVMTYWQDNSEMYFGTLPRSMFSLLSLVLLAEYPEFMRPLFFTNTVLMLIVLAFVFFAVFGILVATQS